VRSVDGEFAWEGPCRDRAGDGALVGQCGARVDHRERGRLAWRREPVGVRDDDARAVTEESKPYRRSSNSYAGKLRMPWIGA